MTGFTPDAPVLHEIKNHSEELTKADVIAWCRQKLAGYKVPRLVEFRDELPKTIVGKVLRRALREEEEQKMANRKKRRSTDSASASPNTGAETAAALAAENGDEPVGHA